MESEYQAAAAQRGLPADGEAEAAVLSSMLMDKDACVAAYELLTANDFHRADHKAVFEAIVELFTANLPVDMVTIKNALERKGVFEAVGGLPGLAAIFGGVSSSVNIRHYAKIVADKAVLRRLIEAARAIEAECYDTTKPVDEVLEQAHKRVFDIAAKRRTTDFTHISENLVESMELLDKVYKSGEKITGIPTGFADLDHKTAGLHPSDLVLIAARPSMGKTAMGLNIASHAAVKHNVVTAVFSLEMSKIQLANRLLCSEAYVDANKLRTGALTPEDWDKLISALNRLSEAPLYLDDTPGVSIPEVRAKCRKLKIEKGLGLIVIDYLQLMSGSNSRPESRQQEISEISRSLKAIAREMEAPVIALAQLSRAPETRADHRPILSDLRESGAIEQDADVVAFIYRDEYYNPETEKRGIAEIILAKQRNGETGAIDLRYMGSFVKFVNIERRDI